MTTKPGKSRGTEEAREAAFLVVGKTLATLSDALIPVIMVRLLTQQEMGFVSALWLIYAVFAPIATMALPATVLYFVPTAERARKDLVKKIARLLFGAGAILSALLLLIGLAVYFLPADLRLFQYLQEQNSALSPDSMKYLLVFWIIPLGDIPSRMLSNILVAEKHASTAAKVGIIKSLGTALFTLIPLLITHDLWFFILSIALFRSLFGLAVPFYIKKLYPEKGDVSDISSRDILKFALPLGFNQITQALYNNLDQLLISAYFSAVLYAQYRTGAWQIPLVTTIAYNVATVYMASLSRLFKEKKFAEGILMWRASIIKTALIVLPLGTIFITFASETIEIVFTKEYLAAAPVFALYCILVLGRVTAYGSVLVAAGQSKMILKAGIFGLVVNAILSFPLMFWLGFIGPAVGTAIGFVLLVAYYCHLIGKATGIPSHKVFPLLGYGKILLLNLLIGGGIFLLKDYLPQSPSLRLLIGALTHLILFVGTGLLLRILDREDLRFLFQWLPGKKK